MEQQGPSIGSLVLAALLAFAVPLVLGRLKRVRVPIAAGEILAGILAGKSGLGLIHNDPLLQIFNFLGLSALMFLSGMEIDLRALVSGGALPTGRRPAWLTRLYKPLGVGLVIFGLSTLGAYGFAGFLHRRGLVQEPLFLTLIIATCGLTIIMPVLKDRNLFGEPLGQALFTTAVLGDLVPMVGLSVLAALKVKGSAVESLWILALVVAAALAYVAGRWLLSLRLLEGLAHGTAQIYVRAGFALMLVFVALSQSVGVEAILGAFAAGLLLSSLAGRRREEISHKLDALGFGFLIPIFFLMVGVEFDLRALLSDRSALLLVPVLWAGTVLVKAVPAALLGIWHPLRKTLAGMVLLTTQMSVTIAASAIAFKVGAYGASIHAAVVLVAILTAITGPVAFHKLWGEPEAETRRTGIVLAGMNRLSLLLGKRLLARGFTVGAVDSRPDRVREFAAAGIAAFMGAPASESGLKKAGAGQARVLVAVSDDEESNLAAARVGRDRFGVPRELVYTLSRAGTLEARQAGFEPINPEHAEVLLLENLLESPAATSLLAGTGEDLHLSDFLLAGGPLVGRALRAVTLPPEVLVVSVLRGHEKLVPNGGTVLQAGDILTVVGPPGAWEPMRRLVSGG
jgi:monovalent cation:H+ antiporter-2, CPA2 family